MALATALAVDLPAGVDESAAPNVECAPSGRDGASRVAVAEAQIAWFAVWTRNQCEPKVDQALRQKGIEAFLPRIVVASARRDRRRMLARPLFPGYLFVRFAPTRDGYIQVAGTDGVVRLLGERWDALHAIPDAQVEAVQRIVAASARARPVPWIRIGDRIRIIAGALAGLEGFVQARRDGRATFVVSVDLLQRSVAVEVAAELLQQS